MTKLFSSISSELRVAVITWKISLRSAMALKTAFVMQVIGMIVNDLAFVAIWVFFFKAIGTVNGWSSNDTIGLMGFSMLGFSLALIFFFGTASVSNYVERGSFDRFLLSPRNLLFSLVTNVMDHSGFGDGLVGFTMLIYYGFVTHSVMSIIIPLLLLPAAVLIFVSVAILCACTAFYFMDAQNIQYSLYKTFLMPTLYPAGLFPSGLKLVFIFLIPSLAVAGLPIEIAKHPTLDQFVLVYVLAIGWFTISRAVFYYSVKKYESGNLMGMRD